jgi:peptidoglycan/LPS O-acetylase OafA/YrhL
MASPLAAERARADNIGPAVTPMAYEIPQVPVKAGSRSAAAEPSGVRAAGARLAYIDNIRWAMILLVLSMHAADTYSPFGSWYYVERPAIGTAQTLFFLTYQSFLQGFFMALLFFIAGHFTPGSFEAKGAARFVEGRLARLGLPTLLYVAVIGPVTEYYIAHSWRTPHSFAHEMWLYLVRLRFLSGTGPMWFCAALLVFSLIYASWRSLAAPAKPPRRRDITAASVAGVVGAIALSTFLVRLAPGSWLSRFNMSLGDFPAYVIMFALGVWTGRTGALDRLADRRAAWLGAVLVGAAALLWPALLVLGGAFHGQRAAFGGGPHWQSAGKALWEALVCVGMSLVVLAVARRRFARQGPLARFMSDQAFAVYVIHPPILIGLALSISALPLPAIPKFLLLWALGALACFALAAPLARRIPVLGRVLS